MANKSHYDKNFPDSKPVEKEFEVNPCVKYVSKCWEDWDAHWAGKMQSFEDLYDRWKGKKPKRDEDWQSDFNKRLSWQGEKTLVPRYHSVLFPISAPIDVAGSNEHGEFSGIIAKSMVAHWFKLGEFSKEGLSIIRGSYIYGTGLWEDDWYVRVERKITRVSKDTPDYRPMVDDSGNKILDEKGNVRTTEYGKKTKIVEENKYEIVEDRYRVRKANIFAWRIHPNKLDDDDDWPVIKQEFVTFETLEERQRELAKYDITAFENMNEIKKDVYKVEDKDLKRQMKDGSIEKTKEKLIEVLHYWGLYGDTSKNETTGEYEDTASNKKPMWIMVANRKFQLKKIENPYWHKKPPLRRTVWTEDEKPSYYGISGIEIGQEAEDRANTVVNIRTDVKKKNLRSGGWYNALDKKIKKKQLIANVPGLLRACSDVNNAVRFDNPPPLMPEDYKEEETAVSDFKEVTGTPNALDPSGDISKEHRTLGGVQLLASQAAQRLKADLMMMDMMLVRAMANRAFLLSRQFYTKPQAIELLAPENVIKQLGINKLYTISPSQLMEGVKFYGTGLSESLEKAQNIDKAVKFLEVLSKVNPQHPFNNYLIKRIAIWLGFEDAEEYFSINNMQPEIIQSQGMTGMPLPQGQPMPPQGSPQLPSRPMPSPPPPPPGMPPQVAQQMIQRILQGQAGAV